MKVLRKQEIDTANIQVGDQMVIPLAELGEFTATAYKVTDEGVMFIFDDYVTRRPMNNRDTNKGGFEKSDLKKWMDTVLFMAFPEELRDKIYGLTLAVLAGVVIYKYVGKPMIAKIKAQKEQQIIDAEWDDSEKPIVENEKEDSEEA